MLSRAEENPGKDGKAPRKRQRDAEGKHLCVCVEQRLGESNLSIRLVSTHPRHCAITNRVVTAEQGVELHVISITGFRWLMVGSPCVTFPIPWMHVYLLWRPRRIHHTWSVP